MEMEKIFDLLKNAGSLIPVLGKAWRGEPENDPTQKGIRQLADKEYNVLRQSIDNGSMKILKHLENGRNCQPKYLILEVHPRAENVTGIAETLLQEEFQYRLEFLKTHGVLSLIGDGQFAISHLGKNFIRAARDHRDYPDVLFS